MHIIRNSLSLLLLTVATTLSAAPPFPAPGNLAEQVAELQQAVVALQTALADEVAARQAAEARIADIESNSVLALGGYLGLVVDDYGYTTARFDSINVQIVNGLGNTGSINGLGNLVVGYNEPRALGPFLCSYGALMSSQARCEELGYTWSRNHKSGSHNIVGGTQNAYSSYGGLVVGRSNAIIWGTTSVSGGSENIANGGSASVSGGNRNIAGGSGGTGGGAASVSGGRNRIAPGNWDWAAGSLFQDL